MLQTNINGKFNIFNYNNMASKKLVIKGADFSANGFSLTVVTKEITSLYTSLGEYVYGNNVELPNGQYIWEDFANNGINFAQRFAGSAINPVWGSSADYIDVEDYTRVTIKSAIASLKVGSNGYGIILGFLDSNKQLLGGLCCAPEGTTGLICECVGYSLSVREFTREIPIGCRYICATAYVNSSSVEGESFKITLAKDVLV